MKEFLRIDDWERFPTLAHGFGTAFCGFTGLDGDDNSVEMRKQELVRLASQRAMESFGPSFDRVLTVKQIHSTRIHCVHRDDVTPESYSLECDALLTDKPGLLIAVKTADCLPILIFDPEKKVVGAVHAGWRGSLDEILIHAMEAMQSEFGSHVNTLRVGLGPCAKGCCYEVSDDLADQFLRKYGDEALAPVCWTTHLDLTRVNEIQAMRYGVLPEYVSRLDYCTICGKEPLLYSFRRDKGRTGRLLNVIGLCE